MGLLASTHMYTLVYLHTYGLIYTCAQMTKAKREKGRKKEVSIQGHKSQGNRWRERREEVSGSDCEWSPEVGHGVG